MVHKPSLVPAPVIFTYGSVSDPQSPPHNSSVEIVTPKGNPTTSNNPPNTVPNVPYDPNSAPILSDSSLPELSDSSDNKYYK